MVVFWDAIVDDVVGLAIARLSHMVPLFVDENIVLSMLLDF